MQDYQLVIFESIRKSKNNVIFFFSKEKTLFFLSTFSSQLEIFRPRKLRVHTLVITQQH